MQKTCHPGEKISITPGSAETIPEHTHKRSKTPPAETNPDDVYLSAAENGDHAVAQKMVDDAAAAWGGKAYYHASNDAWSTPEDRPIYLSTSEKIARKYNPTGVVRKFYVKFPGRGIYKAEKGETSYMHYGMTGLARRLSDEGYSAMQGLPAASGYGGAEVVVLKPQGIVQLADPIVRDEVGKIVPLRDRFALKPP